MNWNAAVLTAIIGLFLFFIGLGMDATQTNVVTTCTGPGIYSQCAETVVRSPNPARGATIFLGVVLSIIGFIGAVTSGGSSDRETLSGSGRETTSRETAVEETEQPTLLQERVREHREDENRD